MSPSTATARALPSSVPQRRPSLRVVPGRAGRRRRLPFAVLVGLTLLGGLVGLLLLHTLAAQDAFRLEALQARQAALADTEQQLAVVEQRLEAPDGLAARARALGMVPAGTISSVRRRHGRVVGVVPPAAAPVVVTHPSAAQPAQKTTQKSTQKSTPAAKPRSHAARRAAHRQRG